MLIGPWTALFGRKDFADATSAGAPLREKTHDPLLTLPALLLNHTGAGMPKRKREPTPLQQRGKRLVNLLRGQSGESQTAMDADSMPRIGIALGGGSARGRW